MGKSTQPDCDDLGFCIVNPYDDPDHDCGYRVSVTGAARNLVTPGRSVIDGFCDNFDGSDLEDDSDYSGPRCLPDA